MNWKSGPLRNAGIAAPPPAFTALQAFPVRIDGTGKYFLDQYDKPVLLCGDAPQIAPNMLGVSDLEFYLQDRFSRRMNGGWMILADNAFQTSPPNNVFGQPPFNGADFTNFNEPFWVYIDYIMKNRTLHYGFTTLAMPAFIGLHGTDGYLNSWKAASDSVLQGYGTFLGTRYNSNVCPNKIWALGGDCDPNDATLMAKIAVFAVALKAADPRAIITLEASRFTEGSPGTPAPNGGYSSVDACLIAYGFVPTWLTLNWVYQTFATVGTGSQRCYQQGLLCILGEDIYTTVVTYQQSRQEAWTAVLGGCTAGRLYGDEFIWTFNSATSGASPPPTWQTQMAAAGSVGQQLLGNAMRSREFWKMAPDLLNAVMTSGFSNGSYCGSTSDGQTIFAYIPSSQTITIAMSAIVDSGSLAKCWWYDPTNGATILIGTFANTGTKNFTTPGNNAAGDADWVLVIDSNAAGLGAPGT